MACRVPVTDVAKAIHCLKQDGGVILTDFAPVAEVAAVNDDAAPYLEAVAKEVQPSTGCPFRHSLIILAHHQRTTPRNVTVP